MQNGRGRAFRLCVASSYPCHRQQAKKVTLFSKKGHFHHKGAAEFYKYPWRHSLQSGTSAFHGSCRTSTAKLRSRVCRVGESCMRSFFACCVFMRLYFIHSLAASTLSSGEKGKSDPPSAIFALLSYRYVHEGVQKWLSAPGRISLSITYHRVNSWFYTVCIWEIGSVFLFFTARRCYRSL